MACALFFFVKKGLPWFDDVQSSKESEVLNFRSKFAKFRLKNRVKHAEDLESRCTELKQLFQYLRLMRLHTTRPKTEKQGCKEDPKQRFCSRINYDKLIELLPKV